MTRDEAADLALNMLKSGATARIRPVSWKNLDGKWEVIVIVDGKSIVYAGEND